MKRHLFFFFALSAAALSCSTKDDLAKKTNISASVVFDI
jgi:hypothetical protein